MPFKLLHLCDLFSLLESHSTRDPPFLPNVRRSKDWNSIKDWFHAHRTRIDASETDLVALLNAFFPNRCPDRVYGLQPQSLTKVLGRCLGLGSERKQYLYRWQTKGGGDLGQCVERVQEEAPMPHPLPGNEVTTEEVDAALSEVAKRSRFSGPSLRGKNQGYHAVDLNRILGDIYKRLQPREAKWFTRMILKDYGPVLLPEQEQQVLRCCNIDLPEVFKVHSNFAAAIAELKCQITGDSTGIPQHDQTGRPATNVADMMKPRVGTKIDRTEYRKARSIKHAVQMARQRRMCLERKYDGEYCQIHIDVTKGKDWIQIFSKKGKDSTLDRIGIQCAIKKSLRIECVNRGFAERCILEGELVVWSDREQKILDFDKLRKHVSRSGSFLGTARDSQQHAFEHLMILFYDILLIDDESMLTKPYDCRREVLEQVVTIVPGKADFPSRKEILFSFAEGPKELRTALVDAFTKRWEGYVMKACESGYPGTRNHLTGRYHSHWIKLKKDYIPGLGDTADFAVIGAGYDAAEATKLGIPNMTWTHFHVGCLQNKEEVVDHDAKPRSIVLDAFNQSISRNDMKVLNQLGKFRVLQSEASEVFDLQIEPNLPCKMNVVFSEPFVFEVTGSGFVKAPNRDYFWLRFPRVPKTHWDRNFKDCVSFDELQHMAVEARTVPEEDTPCQHFQWIAKLEKADRGKKGVLAPWEDSQGGNETTSPISERKVSSRRPCSNKAVPFVRMDTQEMTPKESRLETGEVVVKPISRDSMISSASASSLQTPPTSSPEESGVHLEHVKEQNSSLDRNPRKRIADAQRTLDDSRAFKKSRLSLSDPVLKPLNKLPHPTECLHLRASKKPLNDITNSSKQSKFISVKPKPPHFPSTFSLVRKIPVDTEKRAYITRKPTNLPSSSQRETTPPSPNTSLSSSPDMSWSPSSPASTLSAIPTTLSPTSSLPLPPFYPPYPSLSKSHTILSECISYMPYLAIDLLPSHSAPFTPFYQTDPLKYSDFNLLPALTPLILLVEQNRAGETAAMIGLLVAVCAHNSDRKVQVWDWRLLEQIGERAYEEVVGALWGWSRRRGKKWW